ncbi:MAG: hypothetical protein NW201_00500 [Gemmatimonadales bacterium]|nr:hypothetical protein [Gemmatimonadales bacterium]
MSTVLLAILVASTCSVVGVIWDISWHRTIGRDTFWSPPHLAIYAGGIVAGLVSGVQVLRATFGASVAARDGAVTVLGFRGPLGGWLAIWGGLAMATSAGFDNWWHDAYGLDARILSPPHVLLALGIIAIQVGAIVTALARQNAGAGGASLGLACAWSAAIVIAMTGTLLMNLVGYANTMHTSLYYIAAALPFPLFLVAFGQGTRLPWPATTTAALYMAMVLAMVWILPRFAGEPALAPIYTRVDRFVPPPWPMLLVAPALAVDLVLRATPTWPTGRRALALGAAFVLALLVVQWPFGAWQLSPGARNWFFAADQWEFSGRVSAWRYRFWRWEDAVAGAWAPLAFAGGVLVAIGVASATARVGLRWGAWMREVRR